MRQKDEEAKPTRDLGLPEERWGQQPARLAGFGMEESDRKNLTAARKYAVSYLELLHVTADVATLQAAIPVLRQPQSSASSRWSDIARCCS